MTTATHDHSFTLPNVLKVEVGTVSIPAEPDFKNIKTFKQFETFYNEVAYLLALLPEKDKEEAEFDVENYLVTTECLPALLYATNHYMLDEFSTAVDVVLNLPEVVNEEVCEECVDDLVETVANKYSAKVLSDGLYLVKEVD